MEQLEEIFQPHRFRIDEQHVNLYHLYDDLSHTPYRCGIGIQCEDPDEYLMNACSFETAQLEKERRRKQTYVKNVGRRNPGSVKIAHVRLPRNTNVWAFSRAEILRMMETFGTEVKLEMSGVFAPSEWFVWGVVLDECVRNRHLL